MSVPVIDAIALVNGSDVIQPGDRIRHLPTLTMGTYQGAVSIDTITVAGEIVPASDYGVTISAFLACGCVSATCGWSRAPWCVAPIGEHL